MRKRKDIRAHKKAKHTREKTISVKTITGNILLCLIIIAMFLSILPNIKGIYTYFTDKRTVENTCTVEYHTLTYNYYIVSGSGNISQMQRTETRKGYTGTTIVLGADESLMVSDEDNAYYKMDFEIAGQKYEKDSEYIMPANDITIEQYYYLTKYTITFDTNSLVAPIPERGISDGETFGELPEISKTGYTFSGWYKENTFENQVTSSTVFTESTDITLYAKLDMDTYNIDYTLNNGTVETANPETYNIETESFTLNNPSKTGYKFKGWSGTGLTGDTNTTVTITQGSTGDRSYTANYTANTYYVQFNKNSGVGTMSNQTMTYDTASNLTANKFTRIGYEFAGWNTASDGSGTSYADGEEVSNLTATNSATVILYAQWKMAPIKYAVQIYGINQDVDAYGNVAGLTFGPAVGANYNNRYVTHEYEEITENPGNYYVKIITHTVAANGSETTSSEYLKNSSGNNVTRTAAQVTARENINLHEMTWAQIQAVPDKTVFEDCMLCGDTKSVRLTLNSTIASGSVYNQYGDGAGMLYNTINNTTGAYYRNWNPSQSQNAYVGTDVTLVSNEKNNGSNARNAGGYSVSHIRATLIGKNAKTNEGYAGDVNLTNDTCLYSCIESDLQAVITPKKIKYVTGSSSSSYNLNDDIADSIWLFSDREMYGTGGYSGNTTEGLGTSGDGYNKFGNTESKYYISSYNTSSNTKRVGYNEAGSTNYWWLRSPYLSDTYYARSVAYGGNIDSNLACYNNGLAFGFCISSPLPLGHTVTFDSNTGTGTMYSQLIPYNVATNLTANGYTKDGYIFTGWNTEPDGSGTTYTDKQSVTDIGDVTLYAQWSMDTYNIDYTLNNGTVETANPETYNAETESFTLNNPSKTGYTFRGWSGTGLTGDTNKTVTITKGSTGDRSYTANYTANTYYVQFNKNSGVGTMSNQTMTYDTASNLTANKFTRIGYEFAGWNTASDGSGTSYADGEEVSNLTATNSATVILYAQWKMAPIKYAVQIYGINQDVDAYGNVAGLTFGPAVGANYNNRYVTHEYEEITENPGNYYVKIITHTVAANGSETTSSEYLKNSSGNNVTRTAAQVTARENINLHEMTWAQIQAVPDKTVFEDCMLCGDTKSVRLTLNSTIASGSVYNQYGDGAGMLYNTINNTTGAYYRNWNPSQSQNAYVGTGVTLDSNEKSYGSNARNAGGYSVSHIRATLIGKNAKTNEGYAGDVNLTSDTCLYSCIESDLQAVITPKRVKYVTGTSTSSYSLNDDIADSIWLFSDREMYSTGENSGNTTEGLGTSGDGYNKFGNTESKYYTSSYNTSGNTKRVGYTEAGSTNEWWLRSPDLMSGLCNLRRVRDSGVINSNAASYGYGLAFGFCIQ